MHKGTAAVLGLAVLGAGGCGGSSHSTKSIASVQSCLTSAGFTVTQQSGAAGPTLIVGPAGRASFKVLFDGSSKEAASDAKDAKDIYGPKGANSGGGGVADGKIAIINALPQPAADLAKVKKCAFG
jgi:hypothetical protein